MPDTTHSDEHVRADLGRVLGRIPSGVFILTAADGDGRETGMLASWVQQAAFEPPSLTVAVNRKRYLNDWLKQSPRMALSVVGEKQREIVKHFARGFEPDQTAFEGVNVLRGASGLPVLADALGWIEGNVAHTFEAGDHFIHLLELTDAGAGDDLTSRAPMVHIRRNGFGY